MVGSRCATTAEPVNASDRMKGGGRNREQPPPGL